MSLLRGGKVAHQVNQESGEKAVNAIALTGMKKLALVTPEVLTIAALLKNLGVSMVTLEKRGVWAEKVEMAKKEL